MTDDAPADKRPLRFADLTADLLERHMFEYEFLQDVKKVGDPDAAE